MFSFIVPLVGFEEVIHAVNENKKVQAVLVLTGLSSINITVHVGTIDGSATGKHIATSRSFCHSSMQMIFFIFYKGFLST